MIIKDLKDCRSLQAADSTTIRELLSPGRDGLTLPYSMACASLSPQSASRPHRLKTSTEVYFILEGKGLIQIDADQASVSAGQAIVIPPGSWQHISNAGSTDLRFLCIVCPMWQAEDEEIAPANAGGQIC